MNRNDKNKVVPIQFKYMLSIEEASRYFNIGDKRIRQLVREWPNESFFLYNGNRLLIKRDKFELFLDAQNQI